MERVKIESTQNATRWMRCLDTTSTLSMTWKKVFKVSVKLIIHNSTFYCRCVRDKGSRRRTMFYYTGFLPPHPYMLETQWMHIDLINRWMTEKSKIKLSFSLKRGVKISLQPRPQRQWNGTSYVYNELIIFISLHFSDILTHKYNLWVWS